MTPADKDRVLKVQREPRAFRVLPEPRAFNIPTEATNR